MTNREGRYFARLVAPKDLRRIVGKTELRAALGADYRQALRLLPGAVAQLQHQIAQAERQPAPVNSAAAPPRYPLAPEQIALSHYHQRLALDDQLRNDVRYVAVSVDDGLAQRLRKAMVGKLTDEELADLIGARIEWFRAAGNLTAERGTDEWQQTVTPELAAQVDPLAQSYVAMADKAERARKAAGDLQKDAEAGAGALTDLFMAGMDGADAFSRARCSIWQKPPSAIKS